MTGLTALSGRAGNSALLPGDSPVGNVVTVEHAVPADFLRQLIGPLLGLGDGVAEGGSTEHAATGSDNIVAVEPGAGVEDFLAFCFTFRQPGDDIALFVAGRV